MAFVEGSTAAAAAAVAAVVDVAPVVVVVVVALPLENAENSSLPPLRPAFLDDTQGGCRKIFADKLFGIAKFSLSKGTGKSC